jgi:hypothetical protein
VAGDETGNDDCGKSNGDGDKIGGQATASNGEGGRGLTDGDGNDVGDGDRDEADGRHRGQGGGWQGQWRR